MQTVVEPVEGNKVKLSIEVDEQEFERSIDAAFRKIAREVRVPGFRPGKAPRRILEARLGAQAGRAEALQDSLPDYYAQAVREQEVDAIAAPEIDITAGQEDGPVSFEAIVEVRPHLQVEGYGGLKVTVPNPEVSEEDISAQIDRLRNGEATLEEVTRPARAGDNLTVDVAATRNDENIDGLTTDDFLYELGSGTVVPELDRELEGKKVGDIVQFTAAFGSSEDEEPDPDRLIQFRVLVKDVKEKVLPEVTDAWAAEASEFETVQALRDDIIRRMTAVKRFQVSMAARDRIVEALVGLVAEDAPEPLVNAEIQRRANDLGQRLAQQKVELAEYLMATGQSEQQVVDQLRGAAVPAVKADLALRAVAEAEGISADDSDVEEEIGLLAPQFGVKPARLRTDLERSGRIPDVRADVRKRKALDWLLGHVELVDDEDHRVDGGLLTPDAVRQAAEQADAEQAEAARSTGEPGTVSASETSGEA